LDPENTTLKTLLQKAQTRTPLAKVRLGGLYDDKIETDGEFRPTDGASADPEKLRLKYQIMDALNSLLEKITSREKYSSGGDMLQGTFKRLMDKATFADTVYPGIPASSLRSLPRDLPALLAPGSAVRQAITSRLSAIGDSAMSILEGVRRRGMARGDVMDRTTEAVLIPQIVSESFAKAVVDSMKLMNQEASAAYAQYCLEVASPDGEQADMNQLEDSVVAEVISGDGIGVQDEFLGPEWSELVLADIMRFVKAERMTDQSFEGITVAAAARIGDDREAAVSNVPSRMTWIEPEAVGTNYPALVEAIKCLHALPYELNGSTTFFFSFRVAINFNI
jgi:hypothetical protein